MLEYIEAAAWTDLQRSLSSADRERWQVEVRSFGPAAALRASRIDALAINRVIGLGLAEPVTKDMLAALVDWYGQAGTRRFVIQWSPAARPETMPALLGARGFALASYWSKVWRPLDHELPESGIGDIRVREIGLDRAHDFESVVARPLGVPSELGAGVRSTVGKSGWRFYLAFDGERPIAGAASYRRGEGAWFGFGATHEEFRGRGAQTALLTRRLRDAAADGCRWVSADTAQPTPERPNPSYRNMARLGFIHLYDRPNYVSPLLDHASVERRT